MLLTRHPLLEEGAEYIFTAGLDSCERLKDSEFYTPKNAERERQRPLTRHQMHPSLFNILHTSLMSEQLNGHHPPTGRSDTGSDSTSHFLYSAALIATWLPPATIITASPITRAAASLASRC